MISRPSFALAKKKCLRVSMNNASDVDDVALGIRQVVGVRAQFHQGTRR